MYAITGITGKVGGALARALLADRRPVRAVIRDIEKSRFWASQGCEIARAEMQDPASLTAAFTGTDGVFILFPSEFDPVMPRWLRGKSLPIVMRSRAKALQCWMRRKQNSNAKRCPTPDEVKFGESILV